MDIDEKNIEEIRKIKEQEEIEMILAEIKDGETLIEDHPVRFEEKKIYNKKIKIVLPEKYDHMKEEYVKIKYPSENRPQVIISDEDGTISFMFNITGAGVKEEELEEFRDSMKKFLGNLNGSIIFKESSMEKINGKSIGCIEFISPAMDSEIYNLMWFASFEGKAVIIGFNCIKEMSSTWKNIAKAVIRTLVFNEEAN